MKDLKIRLAFALVTAILVAGAIATALAQHRSGSYSAQNFGKITQPAAPAPAEGSQYEVGAYPAFDVELADGPGRSQVQAYCSSCHTTRYIPMQPPLPAPTWEAEVQKMVKTYGAQISEDDAHKIVQYLQAHYTPDTRK